MAQAGDEVVNRSTGERIVFRQTASQTGGALLEMDAFWPRPGHRAAEHLHPEMEERWELISGAACFRIDGIERQAGPGDVVVAAPGLPHLAWNPGSKPVHLRIRMRPALRWEIFVERLFALPLIAGEHGEESLDPVALLALLGEFPQEIALPARAWLR